jgi:hypothetical protein
MGSVTKREWDTNHDYTEEIIRCVTFIIRQLGKGWTADEATNQAVSSYGWYIARDAAKAIERNKQLYA